MVSRMVQAAVEAARKAIESTYDGVAVVSEYRKVKDEQTGLTSEGEVVVIENVPCRLSFEQLKAADQSESSASIVQGTKLFLAPDIKINPGSKITVTQVGVTTDFTSSSVPAVFDTHQEIVLDLFERWA